MNRMNRCHKLLKKLQKQYAAAMGGFDFDKFGVNPNYTQATDETPFLKYILMLRAIKYGVHEKAYPYICGDKFDFIGDAMARLQLIIDGYDIDDEILYYHEHFRKVYGENLSNGVDEFEKTENTDEETRNKIILKLSDWYVRYSVYTDWTLAILDLHLETFNMLFDSKNNKLDPKLLMPLLSDTTKTINEIIDNLNACGYKFTKNTEYRCTNEITGEHKSITTIKYVTKINGITIHTPNGKQTLEAGIQYQIDIPIN